ncbi:MAG: maleylpyruvate isomerase N-terminal domain-containing protein [Sphaerobacter sp.]|nr:maleylpyruvate isomerase N-terminal domain-containing protein [Sphaerobacter sp.]
MHAGNGLMERIATHWRALLEALEGIPEDALVAPGAVGTWSVKDLLGHIAMWDAVSAARVRRLMAGQPARLPGEPHWQTRNQQEAARRAAWPLERVWSELHETHAEVLATLQAAREAGVTVPVSVVKDCTYNHYAEHIADLLAYRQRIGR